MFKLQNIKDKINTKDYGHLLVGIASEYNEAMLIIENANVGWATIQVALDRKLSKPYIIHLKVINLM